MRVQVWWHSRGSEAENRIREGDWKFFLFPESLICSLLMILLKVNVGALSGKMVKEGIVSTNWGAVMEDWSILGEGLIREIQVVNTDAMV